MNGDEAKSAWDKAMALLKAGKYEEARAVPLYSSDRTLLESYIRAATSLVAKGEGESAGRSDASRD